MVPYQGFTYIFAKTVTYTCQVDISPSLLCSCFEYDIYWNRMAHSYSYHSNISVWGFDYNCTRTMIISMKCIQQQSAVCFLIIAIKFLNWQTCNFTFISSSYFQYMTFFPIRNIKQPSFQLLCIGGFFPFFKEKT